MVDGRWIGISGGGFRGVENRGLGVGVGNIWLRRFLSGRIGSDVEWVVADTVFDKVDIVFEGKVDEAREWDGEGEGGGEG